MTLDYKIKIHHSKRSINFTKFYKTKLFQESSCQKSKNYKFFLQF